MRNCNRFLLGCVLAALAGRASGQPADNPVVTPVRGAWTPRVIATSKPVTEVLQAQPVSVQPGRPQRSDGAPVVRTSPAAPPDGLRLTGDLPPVGTPAPPQRAALPGPCLVVEKVGPSLVAVGKPLPYEIVVRNVGSAEAQRVRVEEQVPPGSITTTEPPSEPHGNVLSWDLGSLAAGAEARLRVALTPAGDGEVSTTATVSCATTSTLRLRAARPGLQLTVSNLPPAQVGQKATFRIQLVNNTGAPLSQLLLRARLSAGLRHPQGSQIEAMIPALAVGGMESVPLEVVALKGGRQSLAVTVTPAGSGPTSAEGVVEVSDAGPAPPAPVPAVVTRGPEVRPGPMPPAPAPSAPPAVPERKAPDAPTAPSLPPPPPLPELPPQSLAVPPRPAPKPIASAGGPAVTLDLADADAALEVGRETTYEIRVLNRGAAPTRDVLVRAVVPDEMTLVRADGPAGQPAQVVGQQVAFAPLASLDGQGRAVYRVRVKALKPGDGRFTARLQCGAMDRPLSQEVSTRVYSDETAAEPPTQR